MSDFGGVSVVALELVPGADDEADDVVPLGDVELGEVGLDESVLAVLELELAGGVDGDVDADEDDDGGVAGAVAVAELEAGGVEAVGGASWRCWQAPNASSRLAATAV